MIPAYHPPWSTGHLVTLLHCHIVTWSHCQLLRKQQTGQLSNTAEAAVVDQGGVEMKTIQILWIWIPVYYSYNSKRDTNNTNSLNAQNNKA